ncbi:MAG: hypothetical protein SWK76_17825 [Actinomycetota bacterium]|nr:hypothetical protein [Actinomycetota bacterium]
MGWRGGYSVLVLYWDPGESMLDILVGFRQQESDESSGEFVEKFFREHDIGVRRFTEGEV